jgi:amino acid adenylation domain-containing protein
MLLQDCVTRSAERSPDKSAVVMGAERLTYRELEESSNRLGRLVAFAGCRRGDRVCMLLPKSPATIAAMIAVLKADGVYVPLDLASPGPRLARIVDSSQPRLILACAETADLAAQILSAADAGSDISCGLIDDSDGGMSLVPAFSRCDSLSFSAEPIVGVNTPQDLAHLLFTSGSTGLPKGVMITHSNVMQFIEWATHYFGADQADRISGHPPLHFDLSTYDIYGSFFVGAELHLVPPSANRRPNDLADFIRSHDLTQWFSVPSVLTYMAKHDVVQYNDFPTLRRVLFCGEVLPTPTLITWMERLPHATFTNLYGPTEATIASSYYTIPSCPRHPHSPIPIGEACAGEELLVLNEDLERLDLNEVGDLYIGGVGLSPGYWQDKEKTTAAFIPHPFSSVEGARLYRTGDLASVGDDGLVYFHGRLDSQVKSRGYRIELGEIEAGLNGQREVKESAVVGVKSDGFEGVAICCAYALADDSHLSQGELRTRLADHLPAYMLPVRWMKLQALPKNANGKIDRRQVKEMFENGAENEETGSEVPDPTDDGMNGGSGNALSSLDASGNLLRDRVGGLSEAEREELIIELVRSEMEGVLGSAAAPFDPDRSFSDLGVDSLGAVEISSRLKERTGLELPSTLIFDHPNAAAVAKFLRERAEEATDQGIYSDLERIKARLASIADDGVERSRIRVLLQTMLDNLKSDGMPDGEALAGKIEAATADELFELIDEESTS